MRPLSELTLTEVLDRLRSLANVRVLMWEFRLSGEGEAARTLAEVVEREVMLVETELLRRAEEAERDG